MFVHVHVVCVCFFVVVVVVVVIFFAYWRQIFWLIALVHVKNNGESTFVCSCHLHILAEHMVYWTSVQHGYMQAMCDMPAIA